MLDVGSWAGQAGARIGMWGLSWHLRPERLYGVSGACPSHSDGAPSPCRSPEHRLTLSVLSVRSGAGSCSDCLVLEGARAGAPSGTGVRLPRGCLLWQRPQAPEAAHGSPFSAPTTWVSAGANPPGRRGLQPAGLTEGPCTARGRGQKQTRANKNPFFELAPDFFIEVNIWAINSTPLTTFKCTIQ